MPDQAAAGDPPWREIDQLITGSRKQLLLVSEAALVGRIYGTLPRPQEREQQVEAFEQCERLLREVERNVGTLGDTFELLVKRLREPG